MPAKKGLYANIHAKRRRIKAGSGETMKNLVAKVLQLLQILKKQQKQLKRRKNDSYKR